MIRYGIYNLDTGMILARICAPVEYIAEQLALYPNSEMYLNCPPDATHIINNEPVRLPPPPPSTEQLLMDIRVARRDKLAATDWTQLPDVPLATKAAWATYRQALRDITETIDPFNPIWPTPPQ